MTRPGSWFAFAPFSRSIWRFSDCFSLSDLLALTTLCLGRFYVVYEGSGTQFKMARLSEDTEYRLRICAANEAGDGPYSNVVSTRTTRQPLPTVRGESTRPHRPPHPSPPPPSPPPAVGAARLQPVCRLDCVSCDVLDCLWTRLSVSVCPHVEVMCRH